MENSYKPVSGFRDLAQFGITGLTGESCAYGIRMLCDVSEAGKALLADYFGMPDISLSRNWNSFVGSEPSIGSIMLSNDIVKNLAQFAFFRQGALAVICQEREVNGVFTLEMLKAYEDYLQKYPNSGSSLRRNHSISSSAPMQGSRNVHAMTNRTN
jgi:hypothetical protein